MMTTKETIKQLTNLKKYLKAIIECEFEMDKETEKDIEALKTAIKILKTVEEQK